MTETPTGTESGGAAGPPAGGGSSGPLDGIVESAKGGGVDGPEIAGKFAGDVVRSVVPESVIDNIPFLYAHVTELAFELAGGL